MIKKVIHSFKDRIGVFRIIIDVYKSYKMIVTYYIWATRYN